MGPSLFHSNDGVALVCCREEGAELKREALTDLTGPPMFQPSVMLISSSDPGYEQIS